jgi:transcriptional regulator with XRE-family HTH domain
MDTLAIIKRIEIRLSEIGMSKADFYRQSGISSASFSQWNTGVHNPTEKKLQAAAECLGVSLEYLLGEETKKDPAAQSDEVSEDAIKFALFGGTCTDAQYEEVKQFARFIKERDARDTK